MYQNSFLLGTKVFFIDRDDVRNFVSVYHQTEDLAKTIANRIIEGEIDQIFLEYVNGERKVFYRMIVTSSTGRKYWKYADEWFMDAISEEGLFEKAYERIYRLLVRMIHGEEQESWNKMEEHFKEIMERYKDVRY